MCESMILDDLLSIRPVNLVNGNDERLYYLARGPDLWGAGG